MNTSLLSVNKLTVAFPVSRTEHTLKKASVFKAVDEVSFRIKPGEVLGLVGESGCGKTTISRALTRLVPLQGGNVIFEGKDLAGLTVRELKAVRPRMQMVFQDPYASLNPRMTVFDALAEPLRFHQKLSRKDCAAAITKLMEQVGLEPAFMRKYPHEFSGGQRQRIAIARALCLRPSFLIADEPVSALDVSIQAQIINLLSDLRRSMGLAMLFISHDLSVVRHISDSIAVMFKGKIVETAPSAVLFENPLHPYTQSLLAAIPLADPDHVFAKVAPPAFADGTLDRGCPYVPRCPRAIEECTSTIPALEPINAGEDHAAACIRKGDFNSLH